MSTRRVHQTPNYQLLDDPKAIKRILGEVNQMQPKAELSIEGRPEVITSQLMEWDPKRGSLQVRFRSNEDFSSHLSSKSGLRAFFKTRLFTTQLIFKTRAIRTTPDGAAFKIPEVIYEQQRRGALRVPIPAKITAELRTPVGVCTIVDLSVTGAKVIGPKRMVPGVIYENVKFLIPSLPTSSQAILAFPFSVRVAHQADLNTDDAQSGRILGCHFIGLSTKQRIIIKQFLTDSLHYYFKGKQKPIED
jgi:hypothetical protein